MKQRLLKIEKFEILTELKPKELIITYDNMFGYIIERYGKYKDWYKVKIRVTYYKPYIKQIVLHKNDMKRVLFI